MERDLAWYRGETGWSRGPFPENGNFADGRMALFELVDGCDVANRTNAMIGCAMGKYTRASASVALVVAVVLAASFSAQANLSCSVLSAYDGSAVVGALCSLRSTDESVLYGSAYSDTNGLATVNYNFSNVASQSYLARIGHPSYYVAEQIITVPSDTEDWSVSISASPLLNSSSVRAVLKWGPSPSDLDSHVYISSSAFPTCNHVYYSNKECLGGSGGINLDLDDTYVHFFSIHFDFDFTSFVLTFIACPSTHMTAMQCECVLMLPSQLWLWSRDHHLQLSSCGSLLILGVELLWRPLQRLYSHAYR